MKNFFTSICRNLFAVFNNFFLTTEKFNSGSPPKNAICNNSSVLFFYQVVDSLKGNVFRHNTFIIILASFSIAIRASHIAFLCQHQMSMQKNLLSLSLETHHDLLHFYKVIFHSPYQLKASIDLSSVRSIFNASFILSTVLPFNCNNLDTVLSISKSPLA